MTSKFCRIVHRETVPVQDLPFTLHKDTTGQPKQRLNEHGKQIYKTKYGGSHPCGYKGNSKK